MMINVRQAKAAEKGIEFTPSENDRAASMKGAEKIIEALDADGNDTFDEDEFCDAIIQSFGWTGTTRKKNIQKLAKSNTDVRNRTRNFFVPPSF